MRYTLAFLIFLFPATVAAAPVTIAAGETYTLTGDLTLSGADTLDANGTVQSPCIIVGNGHAIVGQGRDHTVVEVGVGGRVVGLVGVAVTEQVDADHLPPRLGQQVGPTGFPPVPFERRGESMDQQNGLGTHLAQPIHAAL